MRAWARGFGIQILIYVHNVGCFEDVIKDKLKSDVLKRLKLGQSFWSVCHVPFWKDF